MRKSEWTFREGVNTHPEAIEPELVAYVSRSFRLRLVDIGVRCFLMLKFSGSLQYGTDASLARLVKQVEKKAEGYLYSNNLTR